MSTAPRRLWIVAVVVIAAALGGWLTAQRRRATPPATVDFSNGRPKLLEFGMGLCEQCKRIKPVIEQAARELERVDVHMLDVRDDASEQLAERYQMRVIPFVVLADATGKELWRHEGFLEFEELSRAVAQGLETR